jgi:hypothetical protein
MQGVDAMREIDVVAAETALGQNDGNFGGQFGVAEARGIDHHARKSRRQRQTPQPSSLIGEPSVTIDGAEREEQCPCLCEGGRRRRIEERKRRGIGDAPGREVEHEA